MAKSRRNSSERERKLRHLAEYLAFRAVACVLAAMSYRQQAQFARFMARLITRLPRKWSRHHVAAENIRVAFPDYDDEQVDATIFAMWVHLFRMVGEIVALPRKLRLENLRDCVVFRDRQQVLEAVCTGRPVIVLGGHFGNWEMSTIAFGLFGWRMGIVARALDNPYLHRWFVRTRQYTGHRLYLKRGGFDGMIDVMEAGGSLGLLCDQDAGRRGTFVPFFGRPASTFKSIALMAIEYRALLVVGYGIRRPDDFAASRWARYEIGCTAVIDTADLQADDEVLEITRQYTAALEEAVRRAPEQYFWLHRRWKSVPRQKARRRLEAA